VRWYAFNKWRSRWITCLLHKGTKHIDPFWSSDFGFGSSHSLP
jgi:hypothetical protein